MSDDSVKGLTRLSEAMQRVPVIGVLRRCPLQRCVDMAAAAIAGGITVLEVTMDSEEPFRQIEAIETGIPAAVVGVGSVRRSDEVFGAVAAGAQFVVSPIVEREVIESALAAEVPAIPGAATPTEISSALRMGAFAVKVFPAGLLGGPDFIRAIRSPLGDPPLVPTGGITADEIAAYTQVGAVAVGIGGELFPPQSLRKGEPREIRERARRITAMAT